MVFGREVSRDFFLVGKRISKEWDLGSGLTFDISERGVIHKKVGH
jgi:hypothetical protein